MILETSQHLHLPTHLSEPEALAFIRQPEHFLSQLDFLQDLQHEASQQQVSGVLALTFPMIGEVTLPFVSVLVPYASGATLRPLPLMDERAWLEIMGEGQLQPGNTLEYQFTFRAHLQIPSAEQWGAKAFEKMVQASAQRSIARVSAALPLAFARALELAEQAAAL